MSSVKSDSLSGSSRLTSSCLLSTPRDLGGHGLSLGGGLGSLSLSLGERKRKETNISGIEEKKSREGKKDHGGTSLLSTNLSLTSRMSGSGGLQTGTRSGLLSGTLSSQSGQAPPSSLMGSLTLSSRLLGSPLTSSSLLATSQSLQMKTGAMREKQTGSGAKPDKSKPRLASAPHAAPEKRSESRSLEVTPRSAGNKRAKPTATAPVKSSDQQPSQKRARERVSVEEVRAPRKLMEIAAPEYKLEMEVSEKEVALVSFLPPEKDLSLLATSQSLQMKTGAMREKQTGFGAKTDKSKPRLASAPHSAPEKRSENRSLEVTPRSAGNKRAKPTATAPVKSSDQQPSRKRARERVSVEEVGARRKLMEIAAPEYKLEMEVSEKEVALVSFLPPEKDLSIQRQLVSPISHINGLKLALINAVSGSLIYQPNFRDSKDFARVELVGMVEKVMGFDPEFVLKVALFTRKQLNIRTTTNFLLALAAHLPNCRPYLKKYFSASIALPSDWLEVAEIYLAFNDKSISSGALPAALRKAMKIKFPDFDKYQLAKYNKDSSKNKKKKAKRSNAAVAGRGRGAAWPRGGRGRGGRGVVASRGGVRGRGAVRGRGGRSRNTLDNQDKEEESGEDSDAEEEKEQKKFTLKQLIRKLHITEPVEHVMCLVGKKYPNSLEEFYKSRLPGTYEEERAGKRMKLPVPETWETQVSLKGNKAATWQDLIDHRKLPFMAMLRNLRNLIKAGISPKHHSWVLRKLTDEQAVIYSKQFPFRFFSAYEVLTELEKEYEKNQAELVRNAEIAKKGFAPRVKVKDPTKNWWLKKKNKKATQGSKAEVQYDTRLLQRYRKALDTAVKIATVYNVQPIKGRTIILCDQGPRMAVPCSSARGLGRPRQMNEVALLLGLMCKYSCEECDLVIFNDTAYSCVELQAGTILDNMETVLNFSSWNAQTCPVENCLPYKVLADTLRDRVQVDNLIILGQGLEPSLLRGRMMSDFLKLYRHMVNPNLLYVCVSFAGKSCGFTRDIVPEHDNDIYISGYSDQILRFIAERNDGGQLQHVEKIDEVFKLKPMPTAGLAKPSKPAALPSPEQPLGITVQTPSWRTARVFISSTFRDMHGERDLLTRFVFPELRARGRKHFVSVFEVDLRWGVTEEESKSNRALTLCLEEVGRSQLFVGILGERYGWVPDIASVPDDPEFDWVREYPAGTSVTELEMVLAALSKPAEAQESAFFFFRDNSFEKDVPREVVRDFIAGNEEATERMVKLKDRIRSGGLELFDKYPCTWGGVVDNKPMVAGLQDFGMRVLNNLWNAIQKLYPDEDALLDSDSHTEKLHQAFAENLQSQFIGRKALLKQCLSKLGAMKSGLLGLVGKSGSGKSALLAALATEYVKSRHCDSEAGVIVHMVGAAPGSAHLMPTLRRLVTQLNQRFCLHSTIPEDYKNLVSKLWELLEQVAMLTPTPLVFFLDGLDNMDPAHLPHTLDWLPTPLPQNVIVVLSLMEGGKSHLSLKRLSGDEISMGALDLFDKADVIRNALARHRKALDESPFNNQLKLLMSKKEAHNPLFLKLACEELRVFGVFEKISEKLKAMPHVMAALLQEILARLEADHGQAIVASTLSLLICVRDGLEAQELRELLGWQKLLAKTKYTPSDLLNRDLPPTSCLPSARFAFLQRSIQSFLNPASVWSSRLRLAHPEIAVAVRQRYLRGAGAEVEVNLHKLIAGYFWRFADPDKNGSFKSNNTRAFSELPYHLACCSCYRELEEVVCSLPFIHSKSLLGLAPLLMDDYTAQVASTKFHQREEAKFQASPRVQAFKSFVARNLHILSSHPALTWQQASNEPDDSDLVKAAEEVLRGREGSEGWKIPYMEWQNKPQEADPCYLAITNLPTPASCVSVSPDSSHFATGSSDCEVHLYSLHTGKEMRTFHGHSDAVTDVCFVGRTILCSASADATLCLWHVEDGHRLRVLKGHQRRVNSCASDVSGRLLASASWDCSVRVWNPNSGEVTSTFRLGSPVNCVDFHPEGQLIVTGSWDNLIRIYDTLHNKRVAVFRGHKTSIRDVAYANTGRHIASASLDGEVKLWSATNGSLVGNISGHELPINKLVFSPSGTNLITVSDDCKVKVWSGHLGVPVHHLDLSKNGPVVSIDIAPDGSTIVAGFHGGDLVVICARTGAQLMQTKVASSAVRAIKLSVTGRHILCGSDNGKVQLLDIATGRLHGSVNKGHTQAVLSLAVNKLNFASTGEDCLCCLFKYPATSQAQKTMEPIAWLTAHSAPVTCASFSQDGSQLATASRDGNVFVWDVLGCSLGNVTPVQTLSSCHSDWINDCQWSNIGQTLVTASNDFNLKVWDMKTGKEKYTLRGHQAAVNAVDYKYGCIVSACSDGTLKVWSHKGSEITTLFGHVERVNACAMHVTASGTVEEEESEQPSDWATEVEEAEMAEQAKPRPKPSIRLENVLVATAGDDGAIWIWKPLQARELACLTGHSDRVLGVSADKLGQVLTSSLDRSVRVWQPVLTEESEIGRHQASITFTVVSPDGQLLITGSRDGILKLWQTAQRGSGFEVLETLQVHEKAITCACFFNAEGSKVAVGSDDGTVSLWTIIKRNKGLLVNEARTRLKMRSPVSAVAWNQALERLAGSVVWVAEWTGDLTAWNATNGALLIRLEADSGRYNKEKHPGYHSWPLHLTFSPLQPDSLFMCWNEGLMEAVNVRPVYTGEGKTKLERQPRISLVDEAKTQAAKREAVWIHCGSFAEEFFICGDSRGFITMADELTEESMKIHAADITAMVVTEETIFTASADCTVKVWDHSSKQMGQFFCKAPVNSMVLARAHQDEDDRSVELVCGDRLGNVMKLVWHP